MKKKKITTPKKTEYPVYGIILFAVIVIVLIFSMVYFSRTPISRVTTTTSTIATSIPNTSPTTTILKVQTCNNFSWSVNDIEMLEIAGDYRIITVYFSAKYVGNREENYYTGAYRFSVLDDSGRYYNPQEAYRYCDYADRFIMGLVKPGDTISGCQAFSVLDTTEPTKLVFYDNIYYNMCEIDLT